MASADIVIGLRLHSLVLAAAAGTPVASVDYDPKIGGFMEMAGAEGHLCRPGDGLSALSAAARAALDSRDELVSRMGAAVEKMRRRIMGEATRVSGLLRGP
jgi:polysaccharide pyruvyl transferase WcaK-like protein